MLHPEATIEPRGPQNVKETEDILSPGKTNIARELGVKKCAGIKINNGFVNLLHKGTGREGQSLFGLKLY